MRIRIELDNAIEENEVIIKCRELSEEITKIQKVISELIAEKREMIFYKDNTEYYICIYDVFWYSNKVIWLNISFMN